MPRRAVRLVLALGLAIVGFLFIPNRWFYKDQRPTRLGRIVNRCWSALASLGITPSVWPGTPRIGTITIETRGRRSGRTRANVVTWVEQGDDRYLVSMLGERSEWVRYARAAEGSAVIRHRGRRAVRLQEVPTGERAPILKAYLKRTAMSTRHHLGLDPEAPLEEFARIAERHPVFRIEAAG
jgi:deazaflavin-dependent oxidoreductase (nitroreductase family)